MHDFSQWLQSAGGMDCTLILIVGILISPAIGVICESVTAAFAALACTCLLAGLPSHTLKSETISVVSRRFRVEQDRPEADENRTGPLMPCIG